MPSFMQIEQNPKEESEKVGFPVFAILQKHFQLEVAKQSDSAPFRESGEDFECVYGVGVIGKNALAKVIASSAGGYM